RIHNTGTDPEKFKAAKNRNKNYTGTPEVKLTSRNRIRNRASYPSEYMVPYTTKQNERDAPMT
ncbi:MAG: hypothetical protein ACK559_38965, partial [bacterium]